MILLQLSAGKGPDECCRALGLAMKKLEKECAAAKVKLALVEASPGDHKGSYRSLLYRLEGDQATFVAKHWQGSMLWVCPSPYRPRHQRKNWFFGGEVFDLPEHFEEGEIRFQACRASGAGGQHVNTTDSAVRATHVESGISVRVETERSQHANKRLARLLIQQKLLLLQREQQSEDEKQRWLQHQNLERGNPVRTFRGEKFSG